MVLKPQSTPDAAAVADCVYRLENAICHNFWVLDVVGLGIDDSGNHQHRVRQRILFENRVFMLMAWIG
jgi:hypothetical protein